MVELVLSLDLLLIVMVGAVWASSDGWSAAWAYHDIDRHVALIFCISSVC